MAKVSSEHTYKFPIEDVFDAITLSILDQMKGKHKKNNIVRSNPQAGQVSDYKIARGTKEMEVHFEIEKVEKPHLFSYSMTMSNNKTISTWELDDYDPTTTHCKYTEESGKGGLIPWLLSLLNRAKFNRTVDGYFYQIDAVIEKKLKKENK